jgi:hypothetical protein
MEVHMRGWKIAGAALLTLSGAIGAAGASYVRAQDASETSSESSHQSAFLAEMAQAMDRMMAGMNTTSTGDADTDFAAMMIPHHQGAIDMAVAELRYGKNEQLRRIAQEIIVDQQQEIAAMRRALGEPPPSGPAPTQVPPADGSASGTNANDHSTMRGSMPPFSMETK